MTSLFGLYTYSIPISSPKQQKAVSVRNMYLADECVFVYICRTNIVFSVCMHLFQLISVFFLNATFISLFHYLNS